MEEDRLIRRDLTVEKKGKEVDRINIPKMNIMIRIIEAKAIQNLGEMIDRIMKTSSMKKTITSKRSKIKIRTIIEARTSMTVVMRIIREVVRIMATKTIVPDNNMTKERRIMKEIDTQEKITKTGE